MAEDFEARRVHQQNRRDKLRILNRHQHQQTNLLPVYDPSLPQLRADLRTSSTLVKEEASSTLLGFATNRSGTLSDPRPSSSENNGQGLSLSLSSRVNCLGNDDVQRNLPFEMNGESYGSVSAYGCDKGSVGGYIGEETLRGITGYSLILRGSRFLKPAQKLLEELFDVGREMFLAERVAGAGSSLVEGGESIGNHPDDLRRVGSWDDGGEFGGNKSRLISLLEVVCRRYMQYYEHLRDVGITFECVAGLGQAAPFVNSALKAMSKQFRCLKDAIMDEIQLPSQWHERPGLVQRAINNSGYLQQPQPVLRPQRGLPERAVTVLRAWLFQHFLHPYPTDADKLMLAKQTGLSRCQVSNWFINARVRLWKPMVEEIHTLETQQMQLSQVAQMPSVRDEQARYLSPVAVGELIGSRTSSGVSLTLGLHHHRLGISVETTDEGSYGMQDWRFGRDVCGGTWQDSQ